MQTTDDLLNIGCIYPLKSNYQRTILLKSIKHHNFDAGDFSYGANDFETGILHHYPWSTDKLIIGKFCQIGKGVKFYMNDCNHNYDCISTFPFPLIKGFSGNKYEKHKACLKGNTIIGNDVWIGENATIMCGVKIGNGAIIATNSHVVKDVPAYCIVGGNPAKVIRKRFDDVLIDMLEKWQWWNLPITEIDKIVVPILTNSDIEFAKSEIKKFLKNKM